MRGGGEMKKDRITWKDYFELLECPIGAAYRDGRQGKHKDAWREWAKERKRFFQSSHRSAPRAMGKIIVKLILCAWNAGYHERLTRGD